LKKCTFMRVQEHFMVDSVCGGSKNLNRYDLPEHRLIWLSNIEQIGTCDFQWIFKASCRCREAITLFRYLSVTVQFHWDKQQSAELNFVNVREHYRTNCWLLEVARLFRHLLPQHKLIWNCGTVHNCTPVIVQEDFKLALSAERHENYAGTCFHHTTCWHATWYTAALLSICCNILMLHVSVRELQMYAVHPPMKLQQIIELHFLTAWENFSAYCKERSREAI
jgi:virulence-associated protein VapD